MATICTLDGHFVYVEEPHLTIGPHAMCVCCGVFGNVVAALVHTDSVLGTCLYHDTPGPCSRKCIMVIPICNECIPDDTPAIGGARID